MLIYNARSRPQNIFFHAVENARFALYCSDCVTLCRANLHIILLFVIVVIIIITTIVIIVIIVIDVLDVLVKSPSLYMMLCFCCIALP